MPQMDGPFTEQLVTPYRAPRAPITGYEGPAAAIAHVATNFLEGASQARMRKFMMQEQQRQGGIKALGTLMQMSQNMGLTPAAQAEFTRNVSREFLQQVANADTGSEGGAKGGNPMANFFKGIATNLIGGPSPVKVKPIDENYIGNVFTALQDENQFPRMATVQAQMQKDLEEAWNAAKDPQTGMVSEQSLVSQPAWGRAEAASAQHGIPFPETFKARLSTLATPQETLIARGQQEYQNLFKQPSEVQTQPRQEPPTPPQTQVATNQPVAFGVNPVVDAALNRIGASIPQPQIQPMEPPTPQGAAPQQNPVSKVAGAAGAILGEPVAITPQTRMFMRQSGVTPDEYFLYKSPTESIAVQDYGNGLVVEKGTNRRVNTELAGQMGYANRNTLPQPPKVVDPQAIDAARKQAAAIVSAADLPKPDSDRYMAAFEGLVPHDPERAVATLNSNVDTWVKRQESKELKDAIRAQAQATASEMSQLRADKFETDLAKEITSSKPVQMYNVVNEQLRNAQVAMNALETGTGAPGYADLMLVRAAAKSTDAMTGVRDAEQALFTAAQGPLNKYGMYLNMEEGKIKGAFLDPKARKTILDLVTKMAERSREYAAASVGPFVSIAKRRGMTTVVPEYLRDIDKEKPSTPEQMRNSSPFGPQQAPSPQGGGGARGRL